MPSQQVSYQINVDLDTAGGYCQGPNGETADYTFEGSVMTCPETGEVTISCLDGYTLGSVFGETNETGFGICCENVEFRCFGAPRGDPCAPLWSPGTPGQLSEK